MSNAVLDQIRQAERKELVRLSLPETYLEPIYDCPLCHDTGYVGEDIRTPCRCMLMLRQKMMRAASRVNDRETFELFRDDLFPDADERRKHVNAKKYCEQFSALSEGTAPYILILTGTAGTGKSFLGNAIAYRAIENGSDARFLTAYQLISDTLASVSAHTNAAQEWMDVPLLVLDDLGAEPMIPNITLETVFALLNERPPRGKHTVILTNHSLPQLQDIYGERICSRFYDADHARVLQLTGTNLRRGKR